MYILASDLDWQSAYSVDQNTIRKIKYLNSDWYELISNIESHRKVCRLAKFYYSQHSKTGGVPLIIEEDGQFSICIKATRQNSQEIEEHIRLVKQSLASERGLAIQAQALTPPLGYCPLPIRKKVLN